MPTYTFQCPTCDTRIDLMRTIGSRDIYVVCAGDYILDGNAGDAKIENGKRHLHAYMDRIIAPLGAVFVRGKHYASGR